MSSVIAGAGMASVDTVVVPWQHGLARTTSMRQGVPGASRLRCLCCSYGIVSETWRLNCGVGRSRASSICPMITGMPRRNVCPSFVR